MAVVKSTILTGNPGPDDCRNQNGTFTSLGFNLVGVDSCGFTEGGDRQDVAGGVETWWLGQRFGVRGGVRASTVGEARPVVAGGFSAAIRQGIYVDGHVSRGGQDRQAWSVSARVSF